MKFFRTFFCDTNIRYISEAAFSYVRYPIFPSTGTKRRARSSPLISAPMRIPEPTRLLLIARRLKMGKVLEGRNYETLNLWHDAALSTPVCMCRTDCLRHKFSRQCPTKHTRSKRYAKKSNGFERTDRSTESRRCESSNGGGYKPAIHDC